MERAKWERILQNIIQEKERAEWEKYCRILIKKGRSVIWKIFCIIICSHIRDSIFLEDFQKILANILIKKGNDWTREDLQNITQERQEQIFWRINYLNFWNFPAVCPDGQKQRSDMSHRKSVLATFPYGPSDASHWEFMFATCPDGLPDASHKKFLSARMSGHKSEDCGRRSFSM